MNDLKHLLKLLESEYETLSSHIEDHIMLSNKCLNDTLKEQIDLQIKWDRFFARVLGGYDLAKHNSEYEFSEAYTKAISDAYKDHSSTDAKHIAGCNKNYKNAKGLENDYYKLKKEVEAVVGIIESRKYILKDFTASIINEVNKTIL